MGRPRRTLTTTIGALTCAGLLALTACSGGSGDDSAGGSTAADEAAPSAPEAAPGSGAGAASSGGRAAPASTVLAARRSIVREGSVGLRHRDVAQARERVVDVAGAAGGYVGDERTGTDDGRVVRSSLTLVVPTDRFGSVMDQVSEVGTVVSRRQSAQDVTEEVVDVDSRVRTARASLERVRALLARADRIADVVELEGVLSQRQADLESLLAQQRSLAERTSTASIQVTVTAPPRATAAPDERQGFVGGLGRGWDALSAAWGGLTTTLGVALPLLLALGAPVVAIGWAGRRLVARRRRDRPAT